MNGIEKITARITAEANEAAAAVIAEAEKTAREIRLPEKSGRGV